MSEQQLIPTVEEGRILNLRYRVGRCLSQGPLGELYQAHDLIEDRPCSLKLVHHTSANALHPRERLAHEAGILSGLFHRNIIDAFDLGCDEKGSFYLAMTPLEGIDLHHLLVEAGALPLTLVLEILSAVGAALQYCHDRGIVHQDLSPSSIFLNDEFGDSAHACRAIKVLNFGLAREIAPGASDLRMQSDPSGSFLAPEATRPSLDAVDARADQWSLAMLAYQMLTGKLPPQTVDASAEPPLDERIVNGLQQVKPELPAHVIQAIKKALSKDREQRFIRIWDLVHAMDGAALVCQRPTREIPREELLAHTQAEEIAHEANAHEAVPQLLETEQTTRQYPTLSMPAMLLASAGHDPAIDPLPAVSGSWGAIPSRRWWLFGCAAMALISIAAGVSMRHLRPMVERVQLAPPAAPAPVVVEPLFRSDEPGADLPQPSMQKLGMRSYVEPASGALLPVSLSTPPTPIQVKRHPRRQAARDADFAPIKHPPEVEAALANAQAEYVNGNYREAVASARAVQEHSPVRSWRIIGTAACYMKNGSLARDAYRRLRSHDWAQRLVAYVCKMNGVEMSGLAIKPSS